MVVTGILRRLILVAGVLTLAVTATGMAKASASPQNNVASFLGGNSPLYTLKYAALGDSIAAGLGHPIGPGTSEEDNVCGRSTEAYAYDIADRINAKLTAAKLAVAPHNIACQGAVTRNLTQPQTLQSVTVQPQLDKAYAGGTPHLITLTSGANDVRWASFIASCFSVADCDTPENTAAADAYIVAMAGDLKSAMENIKERSWFLPPLVVATGYYTPVSPQCVNNALTSGEVAWVQQATAKLNDAIREATQGSYWFARFAPVDFSTHDICSADSWIQRPGEPAPFHPTTRGQETIAQSILTTLGFREYQNIP